MVCNFSTLRGSIVRPIWPSFSQGKSTVLTLRTDASVCHPLVQHMEAD